VPVVIKLWAHRMVLADCNNDPTEYLYMVFHTPE
jgi:hypothetical protein